MKKFRLNDFIKGFIDTIPLGISVSIYGIVYGVLGGKAGLSIWDVAAMSAFVFAGASQIAMVQMIALQTNYISIIITVFIVNLRHYLMAASIAPYLKGSSTKMKMITAYFMTDESYAVAYTNFQKNKPSSAYFLGCGLNIYVFWGIAGILGFLFGNAIPQQLNYIFDFAFVAAFMGMLVPMIKTIPIAVTVVVSAVVSLLGSMYLPGKWYIIIAGLGASFAGYTAGIISDSQEAAAAKREEVTG